MRRIQQEHNEKNLQWLRSLQRESWQLELLVSGFAIFLLAQAPSLTQHLLLRVRASYSIWSIYSATPLLRLIGDGAILLACCLIIHVILRGIWIAMIGLESAFPNGIRTERLKLSQWVENKRKNHDGMVFIRRLDDLASSIFAISFLIVGNLVSICILFSLVTMMALVAELTDDWRSPVCGFAGGLLFLAICLKLFNIFSGGLLTRYERISRLYYPVDRLVSVLSLSFIYQPAYDILATNAGRWLVKGIVISFISVILVYEFRVHDVHSIGLTYRFNYDDQRPPGHLSPNFSIQSDVVDKGVLRVFIPMDQRHLDEAAANCPELTELEYQGIRIFGNDMGMQADIMDWKERNRYLECVRNQYIFMVNDEDVDNVSFQFRSRLESGLMRHGFSVLVSLPVDRDGLMNLMVKRISDDGEWKTLNRVSFWKTKD